MTDRTPKEAAAELLFHALAAEYRLARANSDLADTSRDYGGDTAKDRKVRDAYMKELQRAARPAAKYLVSRGDDLGTAFPYNEKEEAI